MTRTLGDLLKHYGVKGMRWGVRKERSSGGSKKIYSKDYLPILRAKAKGNAKRMSNRDLQDAIFRMRLEKEYQSLRSGRRSAAVKFVQNAITQVGTKTLTSYMSKYTIKGINWTLTKIWQSLQKG